MGVRAGVIGSGMVGVGIAAVLIGSGPGGLGGTAAPQAAAPVTAAAAITTTATERKARSVFAGLPLRFEPNTGQTDARVRFISRGARSTLFLTPTEAVLSLVRPATAKPAGSRRGSGGAVRTAGSTTGAVVRLRLVGANPAPALSGARPLRAKSNYLVGTRRAQDVPNYREVTYRSVYPGIDLVYHGRNGRLEYDFEVKPGADPKRIALDVKGVERLAIDRRGDLVMRTAAGTLRQPKPVVYQRAGTGRRTVAGRFSLRGRRVGFRLGAYDRTLPLTIDPAIVYSSYLGGASTSATGQGADNGHGVAVDGAGNAYVAGSTSATDFPITAGAFQTSRTDFANAFVSKIDTNASGAASLVYSTYLGGNASEDIGADVAVDGAGAAYVTGFTFSTDFPTASAIPGTTCGGVQATTYVTKLNPSGSAPAYSTCIGDGAGTGIAVDDAGSAYVTGIAVADGFPTTAGAFQTTFGGEIDAFLTKLNASGNARLYSTYLGGPGSEEGARVAVEAGKAYLTGPTAGGFPTKTPFQAAYGGGDTDAFVAKIDPDATGAASLVYSTYLGGSGAEGELGFGFPGGFDVAARSSSAYVTGTTCSTNYPRLGALQTALGGTCDAFVTKLNAAGSGLAYSTYLGGPGSDSGSSVAVDGAGRAYVTGLARAGFPTVNTVPGGGCNPGGAFLARLTAAGSGLDYSTCLPGLGGSGALVAVDGGQSAYVSGSALNDELAGTSAFQEEFGGSRDAFLIKVAAAEPPTPSVDRIEPRGGPASGGTRVTIEGGNLSGASGVSFGGIPAQSFTIESPSRITAVSPPRAAGGATVVVANGAGSSPVTTPARFYYGEGAWQSADPLQVIRLGGHTATLLRDGKVLVAGGTTGTTGGSRLAAAELYDPVTDQWTPTGSLGVPRSDHSATLLPSGKVLVVGGRPATGALLASAEVYDPATGTWSPTAGGAALGRWQHTATLLPAGPPALCGANCGKVLIAGGFGPSLLAETNTAELYDPVSNAFSSTGALANARGGHDAVLLGGAASGCATRCGSVLALGGSHAPFGLSAERYDPLTATWAQAGAMGIVSRYGVAAALVGDGRVLAVGHNVPSAVAELYDPLTDSWDAAGSPLPTPRGGPAAATLPSGKALIVAGVVRFLGPRAQTADVFDPATSSARPAGALQARRVAPPNTVAGATATLLSSVPDGFAADANACGSRCGKVLVVGGTSATALTELYTPPPRIDGVSPGDASSTGGATVTVMGQGFTHGMRSVRFGGVEASSFAVQSYGRLTAVVPAGLGAGSVDVSVTNEGGVATRSGALTVVATPRGDPPVLEAAPDGSPSGLGPGGGRDGVRPVVSGVSVLDREFSIGSLLPLLARRSRVGTRIRFRLSEPATARLSFARARPGRRVGSRCQAPSAQLRKRRPCTRHVTVTPAVVIRGARAGLNSVRFQGRLSRTRRLTPGRYRVTVTATDAAANRSAPRSARFTLLRAPSTRSR